jgi:hypothetical protein
VGTTTKVAQVVQMAVEHKDERLASAREDTKRARFAVALSDSCRHSLHGIGLDATGRVA